MFIIQSWKKGQYSVLLLLCNYSHYSSRRLHNMKHNTQQSATAPVSSRATCGMCRQLETKGD